MSGQFQGRFGDSTDPGFWNKAQIQGIAPSWRYPTWWNVGLPCAGYPGRERTSSITLFFLIHQPPLTTLLDHFLMNYSLFRSIQSWDNMSTKAVVVRLTMMRKMAMIIISFHFVRFCFVLIWFVLVQIAVTVDLFPEASLLPLTHFTLQLIYFSYFPKDLLTLWKVFYLDTILLSYLVFLLFLPSCFLLISHKESVSRKISLTQ